MKRSEKPYPDSVDKDVNGNSLAVGDKVAYCCSGIMFKGEVLFFTPFGVSIGEPFSSRTPKSIKYSQRIIKI